MLRLKVLKALASGFRLFGRLQRPFTYWRLNPISSAFLHFETLPPDSMVLLSLFGIPFGETTATKSPKCRFRTHASTRPHTKKVGLKKMRRVSAGLFRKMGLQKRRTRVGLVTMSQSQRADDGEGDGRGADEKATDVCQRVALHRHVLVVLFHLGESIHACSTSNGSPFTVSRNFLRTRTQRD